MRGAVLDYSQYFNLVILKKLVFFYLSRNESTIADGIADLATLANRLEAASRIATVPGAAAAAADDDDDDGNNNGQDAGQDHQESLGGDHDGSFNF